MYNILKVFKARGRSQELEVVSSCSHDVRECRIRAPLSFHHKLLDAVEEKGFPVSRPVFRQGRQLGIYCCLH